MTIMLNEVKVRTGSKRAVGPIFTSQDGKEWQQHSLAGPVSLSPIRRTRSARQQKKRLRGQRTTIEFWCHVVNGDPASVQVIARHNALGKLHLIISASENTTTP